VRRFYEMAIELDAPPAVPALPEEFTLEGFRMEDARPFYETLDAAFQDHWEHHSIPFERWWEEKQARTIFDPSLWFLVRDGDAVLRLIRNEPERNGGGYVAALVWRGPGGAEDSGGRSSCGRSRSFTRAASRVSRSASMRRADGRNEAVRKCRDADGECGSRLREGAHMSFLRAKCPSCRTLTAVAIGPEYECHSCGRTFAAGLVRVPRGLGKRRARELMREAAALPLDYPEASVVEEDSLHAQTLH